MTAPNRAVFGCCGAPAVPPFQHKCNMGRGSVAVHGEGRKTPSDARNINSANPAPSRAGKAAEDALAAALVQAGYEVVTYAAWLDRATSGVAFAGFVREFNVGAMLAEPRRFRCDFLHIPARLVVEVEGGCHGVQRQRKSDIVREQLLTAAGLRVVRLLPSQAIDGSAVELITSAIGAKEAR